MEKKTMFRFVIVLVFIAVGFGLFFLAAEWLGRSDLFRGRDDNVGILKENELLKADLAQLKDENDRLKSRTIRVEGKMPAVNRVQPADAVSFAPPKGNPALNRLALLGTEVNPSADGFVATLQFSATKTGPLGPVMLVVQVQQNSDAKILDLVPVNSAIFSDVAKEVYEDQKFATFQGTLGSETNVQFALSVSGATTVHVRGTCGIKPFDLVIKAK